MSYSDMPHSQIASSVQYGLMVDRHIIRSSGLGLITRHTFRVFRKAFIHLNDMTLQSLKLCKTGMMENILGKSLEYLIVALFCFHTANYATELHGCVGLGHGSMANLAGIAESRTAAAEFYSATRGITEGTIEVKSGALPADWSLD